jgi:predicted nucleotide-binding protein (sugar kinase/HSP70/actin superfamily)
MGVKLKIGIPQGGLYHKYSSLWKTFFKCLGQEVILSSPTNKRIVQHGVRTALDELCIPLKVLQGHIIDLKTKGVDYIFIPRYVSVKRGMGTCPKFLTLPDVLKYALLSYNLPPFLSPMINVNLYPEWFSFFLLGLKFTPNILKIRSAYQTAFLRQKEHLAGEQAKYYQFLNSPQPKVAIIGHPYNIYDNYLNIELVNKLKTLGLIPLLPEMFPAGLLEEEAKEFKVECWSYERELAGVASLALKDTRITGIILLVSFLCGPSSMLGEMLILKNRKFKKPLLHLILDENISPANLNTRLETFSEVVKANYR